MRPGMVKTGQKARRLLGVGLIVLRRSAKRSASSDVRMRSEGPMRPGRWHCTVQTDVSQLLTVAMGPASYAGMTTEFYACPSRQPHHFQQHRFAGIDQFVQRDPRKRPCASQRRRAPAAECGRRRRGAGRCRRRQPRSRASSDSCRDSFRHRARRARRSRCPWPRAAAWRYAGRTFGHRRRRRSNPCARVFARRRATAW